MFDRDSPIYKIVDEEFQVQKIVLWSFSCILQEMVKADSNKKENTQPRRKEIMNDNV